MNVLRQQYFMNEKTVVDESGFIGSRLTTWHKSNESENKLYNMFYLSLLF